MAFVYLIGNEDIPNRYKIGSTRARDVNNRLKQLQTGSSSQLYIKDSFETDHPFKLEKMLHNHFKSSNIIGEWFELSEEDVKGFKGICEDKMRVIKSLKDNPFFFKMNIATYDVTNGRIYDAEELESQIEEFTKNIDKGILMKLKHDIA